MYRKAHAMAIPAFLPPVPRRGTLPPMKKRLLVAIGATFALAGTGAVAWWKLRPVEPPPAPAAERGYNDIQRDEYERWMQDLGYTE